MDRDVEVLLRDWVAWFGASRGSALSVTKYREVVVAFVDTHPRPEKVTTAQIERWLQRPRVGRAHGNIGSPATQRRDLACLKSYYRYLLAQGAVQRDPSALACTPKVRNAQPRPMPDAAWTKLWGYVEGDDALTLGLGFFCGLRREELCRLHVSHVDLGGRRLVNFVRKGGGEDVLPIGTMLDVFESKLEHLGAERLWPLLSARCESAHGTDWLVRIESQRDRDAAARPNKLNKWLIQLTTRAGVEHVTPHQLRHSCATNLLRSGVPLPIVSGLLNHSNVQTTMRYLKTGGDALSEWFDGRT